MGWAFSVSLKKNSPSFTSTSQCAGGRRRDQSFLSFGWILSFWTVTLHFSYFYMQNISPGLAEMETSGHVPPKWTCRDVLSMAATQQQTHRRSQNIASTPPTNGISFSAAEATKVRKTLATFQQDPPSPPPLPLSMFLSRPHVYYQQETSFTAKEVLLSN